MVKEPLDVDFYTSGRPLNDEDAARVSAWIKEQKEKQKKIVATAKKRTVRTRKKAA